MKQETLEEAAEKHTYGNAYQNFIRGAQWQQERMYSEEEVLKLVDGAFHMYASHKRHDAKEWLIEQFKKK
jgi:hypothetical protein